MASILAITAAAASLGAAAWYNWGIFKGNIRPNLSSWGVWTFITLLSSTSYFAASDDILKSLLAFANSTATIVTFVLILTRGKFEAITKGDRIAAVMGIAAAGVWFIGRSAAWGNVVLQIAIAIGCIPTYRTVLVDPRSERPGPWLVWAGSFVLGASVVILRWTGQPLQLVYSAVGVLVYGGIGLLALRSSRQ